jgi:hypothetical protein
MSKVRDRRAAVDWGDDYFAKPLPLEQAEAYLRQQRQHAA